MKIEIIFFYCLAWIGTTTSRFSDESELEQWKPPDANTRRLSLDLSSEDTDPIELISHSLKSTLRELKSQLQARQPVSIIFDLRPPYGARPHYVRNIVVKLTRLIHQMIFFPMEGFVSEEIKVKDDGTIATMKITVTILSSESVVQKAPPNSGFITLDLSRPEVNAVKLLREVLSIAVSNPSIRLDGNRSNRIKLMIIPPRGTTRTNVHEIIGSIQSVLMTLSPDTEVTIKSSIWAYHDGDVRKILCIVNLDSSTRRHKNSFVFNIDVSKTREGLDRGIVDILRSIQPEAENVFNENKPVILNLKIKPPSRPSKEYVSVTIDTIISTLKRIFPNRIEVTANIYENSRHEITFVMLEIIIEPKNAIDFDLSIPGRSITEVITLRLKSELENVAPIEKPTSLTLTLKPPTNSDQKLIEKITHVVSSTIVQVFPENQVRIQVKTTKDNRGAVSKITLVITIEPNFEMKTVSIDLSKPGDDLPEQITKILPSLKTTINSKKPVTLTLNIKPPTRSDQEFVREALKTVLVILSQNFPRSKIQSEATVDENPDGYLKNVKLVFTINPGACTEDLKGFEVVNINLAKPGSELLPKIVQILPKLDKLLEKGLPANVNLKIQPPKGTTDGTVENIVKTIVTVLSKVYPYNKLGFQVKTTKDPEGTIDDVSILLTIEPNDEGPEVINLDLTKPGTNVMEEILTILPTLKRKITKKVEKGIPVKINLDVKPPKETSSDDIKKTANKVLILISKLYPRDKVSVNAKISKNPDGEITEFALVITIKPKPKKPNEINLDLSIPGTNVPEEISTTLETIRRVIELNKKEHKTVDFVLNIRPPPGSDEQYVKNTVKTMVTTLTSFFPNDDIQINLKISKQPDETISNIIASFNISPKNPEAERTTPSPQDVHEVELDLSKPGTNIVKEITTQLIKIKPMVSKKNPGEPITFRFNIQPPEDTEESAKKTIEVMTTTISKIFPDDAIKMKVNIEKDSEGNVRNITMVFDLVPTTNTSTPRITTTTSPKTKPVKFNIDLSNPDSKIVNEIFQILPDVKDVVNRKHPRGKPVNLEFDIKPPKDATKTSVGETVKTIMKIFKSVYPDSETVFKVKFVQDNNKTISNVTLLLTLKPPSTAKDPFLINLVTLKPTTENEESTPHGKSGSTKPAIPESTETPVEDVTTSSPSTNEMKETTFTIDLSKPGTSLTRYIEEVIPKISPDVEQNLVRKELVTMKFEIIPPKGSNDEYPRGISETLLSKLTKFFPDTKISVKTRILKKPNGQIKDIVFELTIKSTKKPTESITVKTTPGMESIETTTPSTTEPEDTTTLTLDLTKPGTSLTRYIEEVIPKITPNIKPRLERKEPVTLKFKIKPPKGSNDEYPRETSETLLKKLTKFFPDDKISVKTRTLKKPNGQIKEITFELTIEPTPSEEVTKPGEESTSTTTPTTTPVSEEEGEKETPSPNEIVNKQSTTPSTEENSSEEKEETTKSETEETKSQEETTPSTEENTNEEKEETTKSETEETKSQEETTPSMEENSSEEKEETTKSETVETKPQEEITSTTPSTNEIEETTFTIDLTKPGTSLTNYIDEIIPTITSKIKPKLDKDQPVTMEFRIKPPKGSNDEYPRETSETLLRKFTKFFPDDKISVKTRTLKKPNGQIKEITFELTIEPTKEPTESITETTTPEMESTEGTTTPSTTEPDETTTFTLDLTKPGTSLTRYIEEVIPKITPNIKPRLDKKEPVTLKFKIKPPKGSNDEYPRETSETLLNKLTKFFPDDKISVKTRTLKKPNGQIKEITFELTIEPTKEPTESITETTESTEGTTTPSTTEPEETTTFTLDLTKPGTSLTRYIEEVIPKITPNIKPRLDKKEPVTLKFKIKPPKGSNDKYPRETSETLLSKLTEFFPDDKISVKTRTLKKPNGEIKEIVFDLTIEPTKEPTESVTDKTTPETQSTQETTTPSTTEPEETTTFTLDLTKPGTSLTRYIEEVIPKITPNIKPRLDKKEPVTLTFKIKPPKGSNDEYPRETSETLLNKLTKFFPDDKISVKTRTLKKPNGQIKEITFELTIEPTKEPTESITETTESTQETTTPSITEPEETTTFTLDLTKPGTSLTRYIEEVIPKITPNIKPRLDKNEPVTLKFKIKPPKGSNDEYPRETSETLLSKLTEFFPDDKISVKTRTLKKPNGEIKEIVFDLTIEPTKEPTESFTDKTTPETQSTQETTTPSTTEPEETTTFTLDLTKPGTSLTRYIEEVIPKITPNIKPRLDKKEPVTLKFKIKPPKGSNDKYPRETSETLLNKLTKFFPDDKISVKTRSLKKPNGQIKEITFELTIEPTKEPTESITETTESTQETTTPSTTEPEETTTFTLDLTKPGTSLTRYIEEVIPKITPNIKPRLDKKEPVTLKFKIKPPKGSNDKYPRETSETLLNKLTKFFPDDKISVKTRTLKKPNGQIKEITFELTIEPTKEPTESITETTESTQETTTPSTTEPEETTTFTLDLTKPGTSLTRYIEEVIPKITPNIKPRLDKKEPVTLKFKIKPPKGSNDKYPRETSETLLNKLTKFFPDDKISVKTRTLKKPNGQIKEITFELIIEPTKEPTESITETTTPEMESTEGTTTPSITEPEETTTFTLDLTKPGTSLTRYIEEVIPKITPNIKPRLDKKEPVTLKFKIKPPKGSNDEYPRETSETLLNKLTKFFPDDKISVKTRTLKKPNGQIKEITFELTIEPTKKPTESITETTESTQETTTPSTTEPEETTTFTLDLTKPGTSLTRYIEEVIPKITPNIKPRLDKKEPVTLKFKIKPPKGSNDEYPRETSETLLNKFTKFFPDDKISVKTRTLKKPNGQIKEITFELTIEPTKEPTESITETTESTEGTTTPSTTEPEETTTFTLDLTKPGTSLTRYIEEVIPKIIPNIKPRLDKKEPVTLKFKIKPPKGSNDEYPRETSETLLSKLTEFFPDDKISVKTRTLKKPNGEIKEIVFDLTIEPTKEPTESVTDKTTPETESTQETTTPSTTEPEETTTFTLDLTKPGTSLTRYIEEVIPKITPNIKPRLDKKEPVTLKFKIKPPKGSNDEYPRETSETLLNKLTKFFPDDKISVKTRTLKKPNGQIKEITFELTIEPTKEPTESITETTESTEGTTTPSTTEPEETTTFTLDLTKPGTSLTRYIEEVIPKITPNIKPRLDKKEPVTLKFKIKPPKGSNDEYPRETSETLLSKLTEFFPDDKISVKTRTLKKPNGEIKEIVFDLTIEPTKEPTESVTDKTTPETESTEGTTTPLTTEPEETTTFTLDLTKPGTSLTRYIEEVIPKITPNIKPRLDKKEPVTLKFKIKPPKGSNDEYPRETSETLLNKLTKFFPDDKISVKTRTLKKPNGQIKEITFELTIEPTKEPTESITETTESTEGTTTPSTTEPEEATTFTLDLTKPGTSLTRFIEEVIPKITTNIKPRLDKKEPVTLKFKIKPPEGSNDKYPRETSETLLSKLTKFFPDDKISVKTRTLKKPNGEIKEITFELTIEPTPSEEVTEPGKESTHSTTPTTTTVSEEEGKKETPSPNEIVNKQSTTPSTEENTSEETEETTQSDTEETKPQEETTSTTPSTKEMKETTFTIDLTKPGTSLTNYIDEIIPTITPEIKPQLEKDQPVTMEFRIIPPKGSNDEYPRETSETLLSKLTKFFPDDKMSVKTRTLKKPNGEIKEIVFDLTIEPTQEPTESITDKTTPGTESTETTEPSTTEPEETTTFTLDLTKPGTSLTRYIEEVIPKITPNIKPRLDKKEPVTLKFKIKPPKGSNDEYPRETSETLLSKLTKFFPDDKISVKTRTLKNPNGEIKEIVFDLTIEPTKEPTESITEKTTPGTESTETTEPSTTEPEDTTTISLDLTKPGTSLTRYIEVVIPKITPKIKPRLEKKHPVTLKFKIKPPKGSNDEYPRETSETLLSQLTKFFPDDKISVKTRTLKNPNGEIKEIVFDLTIEPTKEPTESITEKTTPGTESTETTEPSTTEPEETTTFTLDLTKPGTSLTRYIEVVIPKITPKIMPRLEKNHPVTLKFKIKPPKGSNDEYPRETSETLLSQLTKFFPDEKISIKTRTLKEPNGEIREITFELTIVPTKKTDESTEPTTPSTNPSSDQTRLPKLPSTTTPSDRIIFPDSTTPSDEVTKPENENVDMDLSKPGSSLPDEVFSILPSILPKITTELKNKKPVSLTFTIKPPNKSTDSFLQPLVETLEKILRKVFPNDKVKVQLNAKKDSQGHLTVVTVEVIVIPTTAPKPKDEDVDIDLSKPGATLDNEVDKILPKILPTITKSLRGNDPVTMSFTIKPRPGLTESYVPVITQSLEDILTQYFPRNKIVVNVRAEKDPRDYLTKVIPEFRIYPTRNKEGTVYLDLSKPGTSLVDEIKPILPSILKDIPEKLSGNKPVTINFDIKPPTGSTPSQIEEIIISLQKILTNVLPGAKVNPKVTTRKNPRGEVDEVDVDITIEPSPKSEEVDIDLSKPGTTLPEEVDKIMPNILKEVKNDLTKRHPVSLNLKIRPPTGSTQNYLQDVTETIQTSLSKYFPSSKISLEINAKKDPLGNITIVVLNITIQPPEVSTLPEPDVDIDLSKPETTLINQMKEKMPNVMKQVREKLTGNRPVTLDFKIKPPSGSTETYLQELTNSLGTILGTYFPNNKISVKLNAEKDPEGFITTVTTEIVLQPSPKTTPDKHNVDLDLTIPGTTLIDQVKEKMPTIQNYVRDKFNKQQPVTLDFRVRPPSGSTETYLQDLANSLVNILSTYFPDNKINVKLNAQKDPEGFLTNVSIEIVLQPSPTTTPDKHNVDLDLTIPGTTLIDQVKEKMPTIQNYVRDKFNKQQPVTLDFRIKPPSGSTETYLQDLANSLANILTTYFPDNKITVKLHAQKDPEGFLTNVTIEIDLQPSPITTPGKHNVDLDLTIPGTTLVDQVKEKMPTIQNYVRDKFNKQQPVTLDFRVRPPSGSTETYLQDLANSLVTILSTYFPDNRISVKLDARKDPEGFLTNVTIEIVLQPSPTTTPGKHNVDLDLTIPGTTLIDQVKEKMPTIQNYVRDKFNKQQPVTLDFRVRPPSGSTETYLQDLANSLVNILTTYFPDNKISVKMNAQKDPEGFLTNVNIEIVLQPSPTTTPDKHNVDLDLTIPGTTLIDQVKEKMPTIKSYVRDKFNKQQPVTLDFRVRPPSGSTETYLQDLANSLVNILTTYFPDNKISVKLNAQKDPEGFLTNVSIEIVLQPSPTTTPDKHNVDLDLTIPGTTLEDEVKEKMPTVQNYVRDKFNKQQPVSLNFRVKPPFGSTETYLRDLTTSLVTILSTYFPDNKISVSLKAQKNSEGFITEVNIGIVLQPSPTTTPGKQNVDLDLTDPGATLTDQMQNKMPTIVKQVSDKLNQQQPATLNFRIAPPSGSTETYMQELAKALVTILARYYPNNKITVSLSAKKNFEGYLTQITIEIVLQPSSINRPKGYNVDIDLANSRYTLDEQVYNIIPNILPKIRRNLNSGESVTLSFKVKPPNDSGHEYLQTLTESLVPLLTKFFPRNKLSIKSSAEKDSEGYLVSIVLEITIVSQVQHKRVDIDLSRPGSNLNDEVSNILPTIMPGLRAELGSGKPVTLSFNIRPPANSDRGFLNQVANELVALLPNYFPNNRMSIKTSATQNASGFLSDIVLAITIQP